MSKQKSTKTETQRFSGPELSELLDQVAREHGADAAISAVNKIRSGGVAGFFCREEFEVVVQAKAPARARKRPAKAAAKKATQATDANQNEPKRSDIAPSPAAATNQQPRSDIARSAATAAATAPAAQVPAAPTRPVQAPQVQAPQAPATETPIAQKPATQIPAAAQAPVIHPPVTQEVPAAEEVVFGGPRPMGPVGTAGSAATAGASAVQDRFRALLEQRLDDASETEYERTDGLVGSAPGRARRAAPAPAPKAEPDLQPIVPAPGLPISGETVTGGLGVLTPAALTATATQTSDFWLRLQQGQHELASFMPLASNSVATIGPLSLTTPIVRKLRTQPGLESADVIVLTDRAEIVSEPAWKLVRSGHQLVDVIAEQQDWPTLILIDVPVELPNWVAPLENRLRIAGVGLFRYAVPGNPTAEQLDDYRLGSDVPYVIDLISRVRPEDLVDFVAKRHPIASVAGADLNAELLLAMREQVALGP